MEKKQLEFFWTSYVDLMTALFVVMLVLFILSYKLFQDRQQDLQAAKEHSAELARNGEKFEVMAREYERVRKINKQIQTLENTGVFTYDNVYKRFLVKDFVGQEIFQSKSDSIKPEFLDAARNAGKSIRDLVNALYAEEHIRFLVLIEGNAANTYDGSYEQDNEYGYELSYHRALALSKFWKQEGIVFGDNTEIIIAGSGFSGVGRDRIREENNKRFLIQVIPKINERTSREDAGAPSPEAPRK